MSNKQKIYQPPDNSRAETIVISEPKKKKKEKSRKKEKRMKYKGYYGHVVYDDEAKIFHGEVIDTRAVITFQGKTVSEIGTAFEDSVDDYLDWCSERNKIPDYSLFV